MCGHEISILTEYKDHLSNLICRFLPQANRTCPICRADASEVQRDSEWPHEGARHSLMSVRHVQHCLLSLSHTHTHTHTLTPQPYIFVTIILYVCAALSLPIFFSFFAKMLHPLVHVMSFSWDDFPSHFSTMQMHRSPLVSPAVVCVRVCACGRVHVHAPHLCNCCWAHSVMQGRVCECECERECEWFFF